MANCIDALIDANLKTALETLSGVTVERVRTQLSINNRYPFILMVQMEPDEVEEWSNLRNDTLNYLIWYFGIEDDKNETANTEFVYQLRNIHADITKAVKIDVTRGGYAQYTNVIRHGFGIFSDGENIFEHGAYVMIEIHRIVDPANPYQLA